MSSFYDRHRPQRLQDVCGHVRAKKALIALHKSVGLTGQALWLVGESGTGKTTFARIIAEIVAPEPACRYEIDAQDLSLELLREWEMKASRGSLFGGWAFVINEAHGLSSKVVSRLQTLLENSEVQKNSTWLFTTTHRGEQKLFDSKMDACPFLSRCINLRLELDRQTLEEMAERLQSIAAAENLDGQPIGAYRKLLAECQGNMRTALQRVACGEMMT